MPLPVAKVGSLKILDALPEFRRVGVDAVGEGPDRAQFGKDSNEVQAIGLKRKSEYSHPKSRAKKESTPA